MRSGNCKTSASLELSDPVCGCGCVCEIMESRLKDIRMSQTMRESVLHVKGFDYLKVTEDLLMYFRPRTGDTYIFTWMILLYCEGWIGQVIKLSLERKPEI